MTCTSGVCLLAEPDGPTILTKYVGQSVTFRITAAGDPPITYQWYKDDGNKTVTTLIGETGPSLTLNDLQVSDSGDYYPILDDADESGIPGPTFQLTVSDALPVANTGLLLAAVSAIIAIAMAYFRPRRRRRRERP